MAIRQSRRPATVSRALRRLFTIEEYDRIADAGAIDVDERVELLNGEICRMSPIGIAHAACVDTLLDLLAQRIPRSAKLRVQNPLRLPPRSEPQPDVQVLRFRDDHYGTSHPEPDDVLLLIEVSQSSLELDLRIKLPLYARAGIQEVWVVDLEARRVLVHRGPGAGRYQDVRAVVTGETVTSLALPEVELAVADILISLP
jgi:Uma2 family endonuclease